MASQVYAAACATLEERERTYASQEQKAQAWAKLNTTMLVSGALMLVMRLPESIHVGWKIATLVTVLVLLVLLGLSYRRLYQVLNTDHLRGRSTFGGLRSALALDNTTLQIALFKTLEKAYDDHTSAIRRKGRALEKGIRLAWWAAIPFTVTMVMTATIHVIY